MARVYQKYNMKAIMGRTQQLFRQGYPWDRAMKMAWSEAKARKSPRGKAGKS